MNRTLIMLALAGAVGGIAACEHDNDDARHHHAMTSERNAGDEYASASDVDQAGVKSSCAYEKSDAHAARQRSWDDGAAGDWNDARASRGPKHQYRESVQNNGDYYSSAGSDDVANGGTAITPNDIPAPARQALVSAAKGNTLLNPKRVTSGNGDVYIARATIDGQDYKMAADANGRLLWKQQVNVWDEIER